MNRFLSCCGHASLKKTEQWVTIKCLVELPKTATETFICYVKYLGKISSQQLVQFSLTMDFQNVADEE
jgi:hypothetical protein